MAVQYQKQWKVPSESNPDKSYTVSLTMDNKYICHCWPFLRNRSEDCAHITLVRGMNGGTEIRQLTSEERTNILLREYAEKGYRLIEWFHEPLQSWDREQVDRMRQSKNFADLKTFAVGSRRLVVVKEAEWVYEAEIKAFRERIESCDFRAKGRDKLKEAFRKQYFNMVQHILYNSTGTVMNPNLPEGSVYTNGYYGKQLHQLSQRYKWLR